MKRLNFACVTVLSLCMALSAYAQFDHEGNDHDRVYIRLDLGAALVQDGKLIRFDVPVRANVDYQVGLAVGAAIGYNFNRYLSAEFEFEGVATDIKSVAGFYSYDTYLNNLPFLFNLVYSHPLHNRRITPYIGAGLGGSITTFGTDGFGDEYQFVFGSETDVVFAWKVFAGMRFEINPTVSLGIGYKYLATEDTSFSFPPLFPYLGPNLTVGFSGIRAHLVTASFQIRF